MRTKISFSILFLLFSLSIVYAETSSSSINWASRGYVDQEFCHQNGDCNISNANIINQTVSNINLTGDFNNTPYNIKTNNLWLDGRAYGILNTTEDIQNAQNYWNNTDVIFKRVYVNEFLDMNLNDIDNLTDLNRDGDHNIEVFGYAGGASLGTDNPIFSVCGNTGGNLGCLDIQMTDPPTAGENWATLSSDKQGLYLNDDVLVSGDLYADGTNGVRVYDPFSGSGAELTSGNGFKLKETTSGTDSLIEMSIVSGEFLIDNNMAGSARLASPSGGYVLLDPESTLGIEVSSQCTWQGKADGGIAAFDTSDCTSFRFNKQVVSVNGFVDADAPNAGLYFSSGNLLLDAGGGLATILFDPVTTGETQFTNAMTGVYDFDSLGTTFLRFGQSINDFKIQPDAYGDVTLFEDTDVGDAIDGKQFIVHRKAAEGDDSFTIDHNQGGYTRLTATDNLQFFADSSYIGQYYISGYIQTDNKVFCLGAGADYCYTYQSSTDKLIFSNTSGYTDTGDQLIIIDDDLTNITTNLRVEKDANIDNKLFVGKDDTERVPHLEVYSSWYNLQTGLMVKGYGIYEDINISMGCASNQCGLKVNGSGTDMILEADDLILIKSQGELVGFFSKNYFGFYDDKASKYGQSGSHYGDIKYDSTDKRLEIATYGDINDTYIDSNLVVEDNFTGNQIYGEMWNRTPSASPYTLSINTIGIYYNLTGLTSGMNNGFQFTEETQANGGSYLTAQVSGRYQATASLCSIVSSASGDLYAYAISHEFERSNHNNCYARRTAVNKVGCIPITCFIDVEEGTRVNLQVEQETGGLARDIAFTTVNLNLVRIGD